MCGSQEICKIITKRRKRGLFARLIGKEKPKRIHVVAAILSSRKFQKTPDRIKPPKTEEVPACK
jgi:hypothetical protein